MQSQRFVKHVFLLLLILEFVRVWMLFHHTNKTCMCCGNVCACIVVICELWQCHITNVCACVALSVCVCVFILWNVYFKFHCNSEVFTLDFNKIWEKCLVLDCTFHHYKSQKFVYVSNSFSWWYIAVKMIWFTMMFSAFLLPYYTHNMKYVTILLKFWSICFSILGK